MKHLLLSLIILPLFAHAHSIEDVELPNIVPATADRPELHLNGAALRELYLLVKSYIGALYLESPSQSAEDILNDTTTHKRMVFHVLMNKVGARRIANALQEALVVNITKDEHKALKKELEQMLSYFEGKMHKGEEAIFDYIPGEGTRVVINNQVKGIIPGDLYFRAMMSMWIGDNPVGRSFKNDILGVAPDESTQYQYANSSDR